MNSMQQGSEPEKPLADKPISGLNLSPRRAKALVATIALAVGMTAAAPFYFSRYETAPTGNRTRHLITTHDLWILLYTTEQFDKDLRSGVLHPRWDADINHGYGRLTLIYYPPGFFYLASAAHAVFTDWLNALFVVTALALAASGLALYFLARMFYSVLASAVAAFFYVMAPMHMLDLYWRGGLPSVVGYVFPPLIIYFAYKLGREGKGRYYAGLALFYGLHLLTHLPVALMFSYALAFYAVVWSVKERNWRIAARLAGAMSIGLLLSATYWLPAALETKYAYEYTSDIFPYHQSYVTLLEIGDGSMFPDFFRVLNSVFVFGILALVVIVLVLRAISRRDKGANAGPQWTPLGMWMVMAIAATFMVTSFSIYISKLLPKLQVAVPAWRWLAIAVMFTSLLIGATIDLLRKPTNMPPRVLRTCRIAFAVIIALNLGLSIRSTIIKPLSNPTYYPAASTAAVLESGWTPKGSTHPQELADTPRVVAEPESTAIEIARWDPENREINVKAGQPTMLRLKTYNFPGWTARIDGTVVPMLSDKDGIQQVEVPPGIHVVQATFENTPPRTAAAWLSGLGLLLIVGLSIAGRAQQTRTEAARRQAGSGPETEHVAASPAKGFRSVPLKVLGSIAIVIIIGAAIVVVTNKRSDSGSAKSQPGSSDNPALQGSPSTRSDTHLYVTGQDSLIVAVDEKALDQIVAALSRRDTPALDALVDSGRALRLQNNIAVRVLDNATGKSKVRVLEGEHVMKDCWVPERWLR